MPQDVVAGLTVRFQTELQDREALNFSQREFMIKKLKKLNNDRQKTLNAYLMEAIPLELLKSEQARITREINNLEAELEKASFHSQQSNQIAEIGVRMASNCYIAYQKAKPLQRRLLNQTFFKKIFVKDENISSFERSEIFEDIEQLRNTMHCTAGSNSELGGGRGIRTPGPLRVNGFQVRFGALHGFARSPIP